MKSDTDNSHATMVVRLQGSKSVVFLVEKISRFPEVLSINSNKTPEDE